MCSCRSDTPAPSRATISRSPPHASLFNWLNALPRAHIHSLVWWLGCFWPPMLCRSAAYNNKKKKVLTVFLGNSYQSCNVNTMKLSGQPWKTHNQIWKRPFMYWTYCHDFLAIDILVNLNDNTSKVTDDFTYLGASAYEYNIEFSVSLTDKNTDGTNDTLVVSMKNTTTSDTGDILFKVHYKT